MKVLHVMWRMSVQSPGAAGLIMEGIKKYTPVDTYPLLYSSCGIENEIVLVDNSPIIGKKIALFRFLNKLPKLLHPQRLRTMPYNADFWGVDCAADINLQQASCVHLHWIADARVSLRALKKIYSPIVWTMHDVWPLTGGCHCNQECMQWQTGCQGCPQMQQGLAGFSITALAWKHKKTAYAAVPFLYPVTPSRWLGDMVRASPLFRGREVSVIPNCIDTNLFHPVDKEPLRRKLGIAPNARVLAFGALDVDAPYKGADLLVETLQYLAQIDNAPYHLLVFGGSKSHTTFGVSYPITNLGLLFDKEDVARTLQTADVFLGPSRQDNFPTVYLEASSCGVPCAGFDIGGISEITRHRETGYLAKPFDCAELASGIVWILKDEVRYRRISQEARKMAEEKYSLRVGGQAYAALYERILCEKRHIQ